MPATSTVRTVAEVMSSPAITAHSSETVAEVSKRMAEQKKGSVVIVDGERPIGILTERDLVRFNATGAAAARHQGQRVDDAAGRLRRARPLGAGGVPRVRRARLPPPPRGRRRQARRRRVAAGADGRGADPAGGAPVEHRGAARARGRDRGRDLGRRRPRPRGLLPLPPVQRRRAGRQAAARGRVAPAVRGPPAVAGGAGRVRGRGEPAARRAAVGRRAAAGARGVEPDRDGGGALGHVDGRRRRGLPAHARHRQGGAAAQRAADVRRHAHADHGDPPPAAGLSSRSRRATTSATAPTTSGCSPARSSTPTRAAPSSSTRSPRSTTASTPRPSPPA